MARRAKEKIEEPAAPSILQRLVEEQQQRSLEEEFSSDVAVLFCGAKKSGKTALVDRFINPQKDEKDLPKATVALEYKFARYASETSTTKVLAHLYDLGGDENVEGLTAIPISVSTIGNLVLCLTVDLSEPHNVVSTLERWLGILRTQASKSLEELAKTSQAGQQRAQAVAASRAEVFAEHADTQSVRVFPVPLVIFGTKYDVLSADTDPEKKKCLCKALRHFAHANGASLVFCSLKDKGTIKHVHNLLRHLLFGVAPKTGLPEQLDAGKPLAITAGKDSLQSIGSAGQSGGDKAWREAVARMFPDPTPAQKGGKVRESDQLGEDLLKYPESAVDGMVEQRTEELNQYRRQVERNQRLASEGVEAKIPASAYS